MKISKAQEAIWCVVTGVVVTLAIQYGCSFMGHLQYSSDVSVPQNNAFTPSDSGDNRRVFYQRKARKKWNATAQTC